MDKYIKIKKRAVLVSLVIGFLMFFGKTSAYLLTNSAAILSDSIESIVHIIATGIAFYSMLLSLKPADRIYPYGYGKIEYFSAGFEGAFITVAAISIIFYALEDIIVGSEIKRLDTGAVIIACASFINFFLGIFLIKTGKKTNSLILLADGKHVLTDFYTSLGIIIGIILVIITNIKIIDPIVAIIVALNILFTGRKLIRQSIRGLMNKIDEGIINKVALRLNSERMKNENWIDLHRFRCWKAGEKYFVDFHLTVPFFLSVEESHGYNKELFAIFKEIFNTSSVEIMLHIDPCTTFYCSICRKKECKFRKNEYAKDIVWNSNKIISGGKL